VLCLSVRTAVLVCCVALVGNKPGSHNNRIMKICATRRRKPEISHNLVVLILLCSNEMLCAAQKGSAELKNTGEYLLGLLYMYIYIYIHICIDRKIDAYIAINLRTKIHA